MIIQPKRILCVIHQKVLPPDFSTRLAEEGIEIHFADSAAAGYELARNQSFTLFLFSDRLRTGSGIELYRWVRRFNQQTPTIIVISSSMKGQITKARALKAQVILSTPISAAFLVKIISQLIPDNQQPLPVPIAPEVAQITFSPPEERKL